MTSRRTFLKLSSAATASAALSTPLRAFADDAKPIRAWRTSPHEEFASIPAPAWQSAAPGSAPSIRLDPATRAQKILGFGAAMTDASCYLLGQLNDSARRALLDDAFGPHGLRLSVARTTIGSSDYSLNAYTYDDTPEPDPPSPTSPSITTANTSSPFSATPAPSTPTSSSSPLRGPRPHG